MTSSKRTIILVGLVLSLGIDLLPLGRWGEHLGLGKLVGHEALYFAAALAVLLYVLLVEKRPLSSIGFRRPGIVDLLLAVIAGVALVAGIVVIYQFVFPALHLHMNVAVMSKLLNTPLWYRFILVTRAAVNEEIVFRGYPIERLIELTKLKWVAAIVSWAFFTYAHLSGWGAPQLIVAGYGGVILVGLYMWRRNLWANMLAHWIGDGAGFLLPR